MQLILAIEPDRRQATQISAIVRAHLAAELVIAGSTSKALKALGERVPDLILTPALLPPADDTMLADRLRELGSAAAHIQAVTIPILAAPAGEEDHERGMLSALRRDRPRERADGGCEPAVFINQVAAYLQRAAQERQTRVMLDPPPAEPAAVEQAAMADAQPAATTADSELAEWLDIDQVMAAIADRGTNVDQPQPIVLLPQPHDYVSASPQLAIEETVDDQWGLFDPRQCGFPALLARLNAIANADEANS
jgi:CheY-like chemotaxis protein